MARTEEDPITVMPADECLISPSLAARVCDMSLWNLRQAIRLGKGPRVIRLTGTKTAIRVRDLKAWITSREVRA